MPKVSGPPGRDRGMPARGGEHPEHREHERERADGASPAGDSHTRLGPGSTGRKIGEEGVQLAVRPRLKQALEPFFKLVRAEPPLGRRVP